MDNPEKPASGGYVQATDAMLFGPWPNQDFFEELDALKAKTELAILSYITQCMNEGLSREQASQKLRDDLRQSRRTYAG